MVDTWGNEVGEVRGLQIALEVSSAYCYSRDRMLHTRLNRIPRPMNINIVWDD